MEALRKELLLKYKNKEAVEKIVETMEKLKEATKSQVWTITCNSKETRYNT